MGCVCLASKIEESPRRLRDVINVFTHIRQVRQGKPIKPVILDPEYIRLKNDIIKAERRVLKELGFCVHIKHPHKLIVMYLQLLSFENDHKFTQMSWNFMNDSLRTDCFVRYQPETIACACIYLSARKLAIPLPRHPAWYSVLGVEQDDIKECCYRIICLYQRSKPIQDQLEKECETLKAARDEKRNAARGNAAALGAVDSPASQPSSPVRQDRNGGEDGRGRRSSKSRKGKKRERSWSHSPIRKGSRKGRSRSRDRASHHASSSHHDRDRKHGDSHKSYTEKYKKGDRIERDHYRR